MLESFSDVSFANLWFNRLAASVDCYVWFLSHSMIDAMEVFSKTSSSHLLPYLYHFNANFALLSTKHAAFSTSSPSEIEQYQKNKSAVVLRMFKLMLVLVEKHDFLRNISKMLDDNFFEILFKSILSPNRLGFVQNSKEAKKLTMITSKLCGLLNKQLQAAPRRHERLVVVLEGLLKKPKMNLGSLDFQHTHLNTERASFLSSGYLQLHQCGLLQAHWQATGLVRNIFFLLIQNPGKYCRRRNRPDCHPSFR